MRQPWTMKTYKHTDDEGVTHTRCQIFDSEGYCRADGPQAGANAVSAIDMADEAEALAAKNPSGTDGFGMTFAKVAEGLRDLVAREGGERDRY